jgi:hypothetical protein
VLARHDGGCWCRSMTSTKSPPNPPPVMVPKREYNSSDQRVRGKEGQPGQSQMCVQNGYLQEVRVYGVYRFNSKSKKAGL